MFCQNLLYAKQNLIFPSLMLHELLQWRESDKVEAKSNASLPPVPDYLDFAKSVLRIPEAHEMIARYTVLDEEAKRLILLRPYQIHAIEAIREASKTGKIRFCFGIQQVLAKH